MEAPLCILCNTRHWSREKCPFIEHAAERKTVKEPKREKRRVSNLHAEHASKGAERVARWRQRHKEKHAALQRARRARQKAARTLTAAATAEGK
jgi:hypothetical protein